MPITLLDGILLGVTLFSAVLAMVRGFSREVLAVASWVAAAAAAFFLYPVLTPFVMGYTASDKVAMIGAAAVIFVVALIVVSYITMRIADFIIDSRIGALDRTLGFVFGAARGVLLVVVAMLFFNWLVDVPRQPEWVADAKSKPLLDQLGQRLVGMLPDDADATILDRLKGIGGEEDAPATEEAAPATNG